MFAYSAVCIQPDSVPVLLVIISEQVVYTHINV